MNPLDFDVSPCTLVIFGASGDLTWRKLIPALHSLDYENLLPKELQVLGVSRTEYSDEEFRQHLHEGVMKHGRIKPEAWGEFAERLHYMPGSYDDPETYRRLEQRLRRHDAEAGTQGNWLFYLAIPPLLYADVVRQLGDAGLNRSDQGRVGLIIEKPFGHDLESARRLNNEISHYFRENQVFRMDHYLGKETVQNILAFRFANFIFHEIWNRNYVDHVQIMAMESVGIEHRGGYYDQAGVVRDVVQNHMLQLLALTAMEPPNTLDAKALRDEKIKVLQAVRPSRLKDAIWGQYQGYRQEAEVNPNSTTPTYIALKMYVDNWRWQGVPFYLRTGKHLKAKNTEITLLFKQVPHLLFHESASPTSNHLALCIQPDEGMHLRFELKSPGAEMRTSPMEMNFHYEDIFGPNALPDAYERLLLDALQRDTSLFARDDGIERAWELVTPMIQEWERLEKPPLAFYRPDSWGPSETNEFIGGDGRSWVICCTHPDPR
jgi:glucose-6-phosphate 1-dehydrogenase